ncbi:unnamed protein product, partial [Meganyctiphanes norvegica]
LVEKECQKNSMDSYDIFLQELNRTMPVNSKNNEDEQKDYVCFFAEKSSLPASEASRGEQQISSSSHNFSIEDPSTKTKSSESSSKFTDTNGKTAKPPRKD